MSKRIEMTKEEIEQVKSHFKQHGYGDITTDTAKAQTDLIKRSREGGFNFVEGKFTFG